MHSRAHVATWWVAIAVAVSSLIAASAPASADTIGLVTLRANETPVQSADLVEALRMAISAQRHEVVTDPVATARERESWGAVLAERLAPFASAEELIEGAWAHYVRFELPAATEKLEAARELALSVADLELGVALVAETSLRLGVIKFENADVAGSARDFRLAYRLAPARAVTNAQFKPAVVDAFAAAVAQPTVRRDVSVTVSPSTASIEVDGTERVVAADGTLSIEVGLHLLVVRARSMAASRALAEVPGGGAAEIGATLAPDPAIAGLFAGELVAGIAPLEATPIVDATLVYAELDSILLVAALWRGDSPALLAQSCGGQPARCTRVVEIRFGDAGGLTVASAELLRLISTETRREAPSLVADRRLPESKKPIIVIPPPPPPPWWQNKWVWIGGGAGLTATAAATALIIRSLEGDGRTIIAVDPCQFGRC